MSEVRKVVIVDDDRSFAESNRDLLEAFGFEVHIAATGSAGLALAKRVVPDVVVLDVMMKTDTEGFEVARALREVPELANVGVLLVTGMTTDLRLSSRLKPDSTWLPVDRVLEKPIAPERLLREVERAIREKRSKG